MPGKGKGSGGKGGRRGEEGRKVRIPPPSIPAYAPATSSRDGSTLSDIQWLHRPGNRRSRLAD